MNASSSINVAHETVRRQLRVIFDAWGMPPEQSEPSVEVMAETDLRGIDTHGIVMIDNYNLLRRAGRLNVDPKRRILRESATTALVDADAGLGHPISVFAMGLAVDKALAGGVGVVTVRNSHHFGAAGIYAEKAALRGCIGMVTTTTRMMAMVPTWGADAVLGTNPIALAAPAGRKDCFLLDMATTTSALGKMQTRLHRNLPLPIGWAVDENGAPVTDPGAARKNIFGGGGKGGLTPLGGTYESGSHKGYGLAMMVQILSGVLAGASFSPICFKRQGPSEPNNIGHFFLAIDPHAFRTGTDFEDEMGQVIDVLHATRPADPAQGVLIAGDKERAERERRLAGGIPLPGPLIELVRATAKECNAPFLLA